MERKRGEASGSVWIPMSSFFQSELVNTLFLFCLIAVSYQWMKGTSFLIQALNSYFFLSADGNLYFSEVQQNDEGNYHCIVTLTAFPGDTLATDQPPSETSLQIKLDVLGDSALVIRFSLLLGLR